MYIVFFIATLPGSQKHPQLLVLSFSWQLIYSWVWTRWAKTRVNFSPTIAPPAVKSPFSALRSTSCYLAGHLSVKKSHRVQPCWQFPPESFPHPLGWRDMWLGGCWQPPSVPCAFGLVLPLCLACVFLSIPSSRGWARAKESSSERRSGCAQGPANTLPSLGWAGLGSAWAPGIQKGRDGRGQIPERKLSHLLVRLPACCHGNPSHFHE